MSKHAGGRPRSSNPRKIEMSCRCTPEEAKAIRKAAADTSLRVAVLLREGALAMGVRALDTTKMRQHISAARHALQLLEAEL